MRLKNGARVIGLSNEMLFAAMVAGHVYDRYNKECTITSGTDGTHSRGSEHYKGDALDFRTRHLAEGEKDKIGLEIRERLGPDYDVVIEGTHIHVEFDPKSGINK